MGLDLLVRRALQFVALMIVLQTVLVLNAARLDHRIAKERIAEAVEAGKTVLDLSDLPNLRRIPKDIAQIARLSRLDLSNTSVADLSPLRDQDALTYLTLRNSRARDLSPLADLPYLRHLVVSRSHVRDLSPLVQMRRLERLAVAGLELQTLEPLTRMPNLQWINLYASYALDGSQGHHQQLNATVPEVFHGVAFQQNYVPGPSWLRRTWVMRRAEDAGLRHPSQRSR